MTNACIKRKWDRKISLLFNSAHNQYVTRNPKKKETKDIFFLSRIIMEVQFVITIQNKWRSNKPTTPCPVCRITLVPVIKWAKNLERAASFVNKERLTDASRTKHSSAWKEKKLMPKRERRFKSTSRWTIRTFHKTKWTLTND